MIELLNGRFGRMKLKGEKAKTFTAVQESVIEEFFKSIHKIDNQLEQENFTKKVTDKSAGWKQFKRTKERKGNQLYVNFLTMCA